MNVLLWHVHGAWTTAFVQGPHQYFVPVVPGRGPDGRGRARTYPWPASVTEVTRTEASHLPVDVVVLQRPVELHHLAEEWLGGRGPGRDLPAVYVEHDTPRTAPGEARHPVADRRDVVLVHVTPFNARVWDAGAAPVRVIEHGIPDPGYRYTGELPRAAAVVNEPERRRWIAGVDLLDELAGAAPVDLFGIGAGHLGGYENLAQARLHEELARRRVYVHPYRWTSLGLSLLEAMHLGMPVVALATTAAPEAVPAGAGTVSCDLDRLGAAIRQFRHDRDAAEAAGRRAREHALRWFGLKRFVDDWNVLLEEVVLA
jgi:glycosyl transferase family 1